MDLRDHRLSREYGRTRDESWGGFCGDNGLDMSRGAGRRPEVPQDGPEPGAGIPPACLRGTIVTIHWL